MKTVREKIDEIKDEAESKALQTMDTTTSETRGGEAMLAMGAIGAAHAIASAISSRAIRAMQRVRESKLHESFGFARFDDFLDQSSYSPMTYRQFHSREQLLIAEGDEVFDFLGSVRFPMAKRQLITGASIEVDGETVIIGEERIELSDRRRILQTLNDLSSQNAALKERDDKNTKIITKGKEDLKDWKQRATDAQTNAIPGDPSGTPYGQALVGAIVSLTRLTDAARDLTEEEANAMRDNTLRQIGLRTEDLCTALRFEPLVRPDPIPGLSDERLMDIMDNL